MGLVYTVAVVLHVLAAAVWVGGMGVFAIVVVPATKRALPEGEARAALRAIGTRFARVGWWALGTLAVTGIVALAHRGILPLLVVPGFWRSPFGATLGTKLALVAVMVALSTLHARDARRAPTEPGKAVTAARTASRLGRATFVLSLVVIACAVLLVRGTPF